MLCVWTIELCTLACRVLCDFLTIPDCLSRTGPYNYPKHTVVHMYQCVSRYLFICNYPKHPVVLIHQCVSRFLYVCNYLKHPVVHVYQCVSRYRYVCAICVTLFMLSIYKINAICLHSGADLYTLCTKQ